MPTTHANHSAVNPTPAPFAGRTLFIVLDSGLAIRNILRTPVFAELKRAKGLRMVVFSPLTDVDFRQEVEADNVFVEFLPQKKDGALLSVVHSLKKEVWAEKAGLFTFGSKRQTKRGFKLRTFFTRHLLRANTPERMKALLDWIDRWELRLARSQAGDVFDRYRPDLVFHTTLYSKTHNLEWEAQKRGIKTAAFVLSWDNPTSKGPFPVRPDHIILWNEILRDEVLQYHRCQPEQLFVSGVPQFDIYTEPQKFASRDEFFKKWGLDPTRKLITYTTGTPGTAPFDHEVVDLLHSAMQKGALRQPSQLLVRLHPKDRWSDYERFQNQPGLVFQMPGRRGKTNDSWNPTRGDMYDLAELLYYSDVNVNVASTITIDAAAFDKPVVNVAFDGYTTKPYLQSCQRYYEYEHYRRIVQTGGVRLASSVGELIQQIQKYLDDPTLEAEGRRKIREEQCWKLDGQSGKRIAGYLLGLMGLKAT